MKNGSLWKWKWNNGSRRNQEEHFLLLMATILRTINSRAGVMEWPLKWKEIEGWSHNCWGNSVWEIFAILSKFQWQRESYSMKTSEKSINIFLVLIDFWLRCLFTFWLHFDPTAFCNQEVHASASRPHSHRAILKRRWKQMNRRDQKIRLFNYYDVKLLR